MEMKNGKTIPRQKERKEDATENRPQINCYRPCVEMCRLNFSCHMVHEAKVKQRWANRYIDMEMLLFV